MPATTNARESIHGHLNESTPRHNCFYSSLFKIVEMMEEKTTSFELSLKHNFIRAVWQSVKRAKCLTPEQMQFEEMYYNPTIDERMRRDRTLFREVNLRLAK